MSDPTHPRAILAVLEQRARRRFGQHFLTRRDLVERMVRGALVQSGDRVVEIGPGLGILTDALLEAGADLTAVELDRDLAAWIAESRPAVRLVESDALRVDWGEVCPGSGWKLVANLPYNVGTALVVELVRHRDRFTSLTVMLQREVVERMLAAPGSKAYGSLSLHVQARARGVFLFPVPPGAFHPPPKVDSAVVRFDLLEAPEVGPAGEDAFERVVRAAFSQRRKTLANSLAAMFGKEQATEALRAAGLSPSARAETLALADFQRLAAALHP